MASFGSNSKSQPFWMAPALAACMLAWIPAEVRAQAGGVSVDVDGVLKIRKAAANNRLKHLRDRKSEPTENRIYVSLPKLFAEVRRLTESGQPIPESVRFLDGLVKIEQIFVYPEEKDLVLAGRREPFEVSDPYRPVGETTGRPVLQLDDLIVALRMVGPGAGTRVFGCSLDLPDGGIDRMRSVSQSLGAVRQGNFGGPAKKLAAAVGPQKVRVFGVPPSTRFAMVCLEADYLMKRLALGLDKSPVPSVKSYLALMQPGESMYNRQWFNPMYEPLLVAIDGNGYEIRGQGLKVSVSASDSSDEESSASAGARKFGELMTKHFVELAQATPSYADLWNLVDLSVAAALIRTDKLHQRIGWNLDWILDSRNYRVGDYPTPKTAETLVNFRRTGNQVNFAVGGVQVSADSIVDESNRTSDHAGRLTKAGKRKIESGWSARVRTEDMID